MEAMTSNDAFLHQIIQANTLPALNHLFTEKGDKKDFLIQINKALYSTNEDDKAFIEEVQAQIHTELAAAEGDQRNTLLYNLGCFSLYQDDIQDAILRFSEALNAEPHNMLAQHNLAYAYELLAEFDKAKLEYERVQAQVANSNLTRLNLALMKIQEGDYDRGLDDLQILHGEEPNNIGVILYLCRGLLQRGTTRDIEEVLEILEHQPEKDKYLDLRECRAYALYILGETDQAETAFNKLLEENEKNLFARMGLIKIMASKNDFDALKEHLLIYQGMNPTDALESLLNDLK